MVIIILGIILSVIFKFSFQPRFNLSRITQVNISRKIQHQRADLGSQEVVGATGAERGKFVQIMAVDKFQNPFIIGEVAYHPGMAGSQSP